MSIDLRGRVRVRVGTAAKREGTVVEVHTYQDRPTGNYCVLLDDPAEMPGPDPLWYAEAELTRVAFDEDQP